MEAEKMKKGERNGKINNWNWINIISVFAVQPSSTLYNEMPCTRRRWTQAYTYAVYMLAYVRKFLVLGRTALVVQFVCFILAITQTVATVW